MMVIGEFIGQEEFDVNQLIYNYPDYVISSAKNELYKLIAVIQNNEIPFDGTFEKYFYQLIVL